ETQHHSVLVQHGISLPVQLVDRTSEHDLALCARHARRLVKATDCLRRILFPGHAASLTLPAGTSSQPPSTENSRQLPRSKKLRNLTTQHPLVLLYGHVSTNRVAFQRPQEH